jgi:hypothetical protein
MGTIQEESQGETCAAMSVHEQWKRVLWKTQPYRDNHVPREVFLASLQRNGESQAFQQRRSRTHLFLVQLSPNYSPLSAVCILAVGDFGLHYHAARVCDSGVPGYICAVERALAGSSNAYFNMRSLLSRFLYGLELFGPGKTCR